MKKIVKMSLAVAMMSGLGAVSAQAADGMNLLSDVKVKGQIRPRYEGVSDSVNTDANALTARTKLTVTANLFGVEGLTTDLGMISVNSLGVDDFKSLSGHSSTNSRTGYAVVADPDDAMISEATLDYKMGKTKLHAGRSNINLDNQRFIGTVGWRQMERSYDTVSVADNSIENLNILAAYVYGYAGVTNVTTNYTSSILLNAKYKVMKELAVTGYAYMIASKYDTYGVALTGKIDAGAKLTYRAEYAMQTDATMEKAGVAGAALDASYMNLDLGANISGILLGFNYESLSGSGTGGATSFNPSLGTNHKFNGWADVFYVGANSVPTEGLVDMNFRAGYKAKGLGKILAVYHIFDAESTSDSFGTELDVVYVNKIPGVNNLNGLVKYASYTADTAVTMSRGNNDVTKMWVGVDYKF